MRARTEQIHVRRRSLLPDTLISDPS